MELKITVSIKPPIWLSLSNFTALQHGSPSTCQETLLVLAGLADILISSQIVVKKKKKNLFVSVHERLLFDWHN